jgi:hypothetical protein
MITARLLAITLLVLLPVHAARAGTIDLATILGNSGFEDDTEHSQWTSTKKSTNYVPESPLVNPVIVPKGETEPLESPAGDHFIGVLNVGDNDVNGRLVHDVVAGDYPAGTVFTLTLFGNRGRLTGAPTTTFPAKPSELTMQFFGWGPGALPVVNPETDDWSRTPRLIIRRTFTSWPASGEWASQTFQFVATKPLVYVSLALTVKNHKADAYVAFDVLVPPS